MRIAIDASPVLKPERTGVARYVVNLANAYRAAGGRGDEFLLCYRLSRLPSARFRLKIPDPRFSDRWIQGPLRPRRPDVAHGPAGRLLDLPGARKVVTVHDVFSLLETSFGPPRFREKMARRYREIADRADRVVCPSSWSREQFWGHHPDVAQDRLAVVPLGVEDRFRPEAKSGLPRVRAEQDLYGPYFLFVGEISRRKNIGRILDAVSLLPEGAPRMVLAGKPSFGHEDIEGEIAERGLGKRVLFTGFFPDPDLPALYAGAKALVHPSLLEGFGISVLEAQACGTPVVCSDRGALQETGGGIRVAVDPEDPESIRDGMLRVLEDRELAGRLSTRGVEWASRFRWARVAEQTLGVYSETLA